MQQIWNRLQLMCALGVSTLVSKDKVQAKILDGETLDNIARIEPYGFSYKPKVGSQTYMMFPAGDRSYGVALIVGDKRYQMDLADGEVALHDDLGHSVALKRAGIAVAGGGHNVSVTGSPKVVVTGGDVIADGISLKNHLHNSMGLPVDGSNDAGETDGSPNSGGGGSQELNDAVTAADVSAVAAQAAYAQAIIAKNDAIAASAEAILAQGAALIAKGLAEGFAQSTSSNYDLTVASKDLAGGYANSALTYKNEASAAALAAEGSASTAVNQVTLATEQKTLASDFASAALDSKNSASSFASAAGDSATLASQQLTLATQQKTLASGFADAALSFKNSAQTFASAAGDSATLASQQATIATSQTSAAGGYASASLQYRNEASTSATNAAASAQAAAIQYTNLSTTVGGHTSSISELTSSKNGLEARWGLTINNNGHISGIALNSIAAANGGNPTSAVVISADKFLVVDPSVPYTQGNNPSQANVPFYVVNGVTYIKEANIADLTVGTNKIKGDAIIPFRAAIGPQGTLSASSTVYTPVITIPALESGNLNDRGDVIINISGKVGIHSTNRIGLLLSATFFDPAVGQWLEVANSSAAFIIESQSEFAAGGFGRFIEASFDIPKAVFTTNPYLGVNALFFRGVFTHFTGTPARAVYSPTIRVLEVKR